MKYGRTVAIQSIIQAVFVVAVAMVFAITVNTIRPSGLSIFARWSLDDYYASKYGRDLVIPIDEAIKLYLAGNAVFFDARSSEDYRKGHIAGAVNFPWEKFDLYASNNLTSLPKDAIVITYCDGEACMLGKDLAADLRDEGYSNVWFIVDGYSQWKKRGLQEDR